MNDVHVATVDANHIVCYEVAVPDLDPTPCTTASLSLSLSLSRIAKFDGG